MGQGHGGGRPEQITKDRRAELKALLRDNTLTHERFVQLAFEQPDIDRIDLFRYAPGTWDESKVGEIKPGFDAATLADHLITTWGPGRYKLAPVYNGEWITNRVWSFGNPEEAPRVPATPPRDGSVGKITAQLAEELKGLGIVREYTNFINEREAMAVTRELAPMKMMADMFGVMKESLAKAGGGDTQVTTILLQQLQATNQLVLTLQGQMLELAKKQGEGGGTGRLLEGLKTLEEAIGTKLGEFLAGARPEDKGTDWVAVANVAAPIVERAMDTVRDIADGHRHRAGGRPALPEKAEEAMPVDLSPEDREAVGMMLEALRSRDFPTFSTLLDLHAHDLSERIDPRVNPLAYLPTLKKLDARFDQLRAEWSEFMKWTASEEETPHG